MAELILENYDNFSVMYDIISELAEKSATDRELASTMDLSVDIVSRIVALLLAEGFLKPGPASDLRLTYQGFSFLQEFAGIRKFVG